MDTAGAQRTNPLAIGQVVARNIIPVVGILAFGWPATSILLLYFVDTMFAMGVMFAGLGSHFSRGTADGAMSRVNGEAGAILVAVFLCAFVAVPLGMPLVFVGAMSHWEGFDGFWRDQGFLAGVAGQACAAIWSYLGLWRELHVRTPEELRLKRRFGLVFLRWFVVIGVVYSFGHFFGRFLPALLVLVYVAATIFVEIAPDRLLRQLPGMGDDADGATPRISPTAGGGTSWRRRRRDRK